MAENKDKKVLNVPNKREITPNELGSAEHKEVRLKRNVPNLRFKEFSGEWEEKRLEEIMNFSEKRINASTLTTSNYISTENMLQDFQGVIEAKSVPNNTNVISFTYGDILISNIRPYLKKVWKASIDGGCSSDVLVMKANDKINNDYLHYVIANNRFINFVMNGAKGVKMPRGDKEQMKTYIISLPPMVKEQRKIATFLSLLDERIATQNKIIDKLESLIKGISRKLLDEEEGHYVSLENILKERIEKTTINNQYEVLSSTVNGIFIQREYFSREIASSNNVGYKVLRLNEIVLSPQNLWMGNINYNKSFKIGIVSPSYKIFSIADCYDKDFIAALLKTNRALYNYALASEQGASIVRRNLNIEAFKQIVFKLPSYKKQCQIGKTISLLEKSLENNMKLKNSYELQKTYLLRQMFI